MSDRVLAAIADPTRRRVLQLLRRGAMTAGELGAEFDLAPSTMSRHFNVLKEADLIRGTRSGTTITYELNASVVEEVLLAVASALGVGLGSKDSPRGKAVRGAVKARQR